LNERKTIIFAVVFYVSGLLFASIALAPGQDLFFDILAGFGIAGRDFGLRLWSFGKRRKSQRRLWCGHCGSSAGQVVGAPIAELPPRMSPLQNVFMIFAKSNLFAFAALPFLRLRKTPIRIESNERLRRFGKIVQGSIFYHRHAWVFLLRLSTGIYHQTAWSS
jgi:hypothetical protein